MVMPKVDPGSSAEAQAIQAVHEELFHVVPFDYIDEQFSDLTNITNLVWENFRVLFDGDLNHVAVSLLNIAPNDTFLLTFVKPIWLNFTYIRSDAINRITQAQVRYSDGTQEFLVPNTLPAVEGGYDVFSPPTRQLPVHSIEFTNIGAFAASVYELIMLMTDVTNGGNSFLAPSTNRSYADDVGSPIPAGLGGVAIVYGFNSIALIFRNSSAQNLQISEDAGVTWETIVPGWAITFDLKELAGILVRDPFGVGGQIYHTWAW